MRLRSVGIVVLVALLGLGPLAHMALAFAVGGEAAPAVARQGGGALALHKSCSKSPSCSLCVGLCHSDTGITAGAASLIAPVPQLPAGSPADVRSCIRTTRANTIRAPPPLPIA